jgi:hypothetical protein
VFLGVSLPGCALPLEIMSGRFRDRFRGGGQDGGDDIAGAVADESAARAAVTEVTAE